MKYYNFKKFQIIVGKGNYTKAEEDVVAFSCLYKNTKKTISFFDERIRFINWVDQHVFCDIFYDEIGLRLD